MDLTARAHALLTEHFAGKSKTTALDATCGNGFDTVFLADLGFEQVVALDIQKEAIEATHCRLHSAGYEAVRLINDSHENINTHVQTPLDCAMFNFGYMPNLANTQLTNKNITTQTSSSLKALKSASALLSNHGIISLICYPGHPQGAEETRIIQQWLAEIGDAYDVTTYLAKSPKPTAPILFTIKPT